jgi:PAS domain S-box-containing protein
VNIAVVKLEKMYIIAITRDITERKQTEDALRESEARFRSLFEISADGISIVDVETKAFMYTNPAVCRMLGYTESELKSMNITDIHPKKDLPWIIKELESLAKGEKSLTFEIPCQRKDGTIIDTEINTKIITIDGRICNVGIHRDITEKKIAENKLKRSEEQLKEAQSVGHIGSWELDLAENTGTMSDEMYKIFDLHNSSIDVTIETFFETVIPEDRKMVQELVTKSLKTCEGIDFDFRTITTNGEIRWIHERNTVEVDDKGNPKRVFGTCQDITERKLVELQFKESEERYRSVLESANDAIITTDSKGIVLGWNSGAEKIFGYTEAELTGKNLNLIIPQSYIESHNNGMKRIEQGGAHHVIGATVELHGLHKSGKDFPVELSLAEWETSKGKFFTGIIRDITERKLAEEVQSESERRTRALLNANPDMIFRVNREGIFLDYKADSAELYAQAEASIIGKRNRDITPPEFADLIDRYIGQTLESGELQEFEYQMITPKRGLRDYEARMVPSGKEEVITVVRDVTERKQAEEEIKKYNKELIKLNAEKDKFFSIIAHDLKSPFNGFLILTELMSDTSEKFSPEEYAENSKSLNEAARILYKLLENLLEWAQLQKGSINFTPKDSDLSKMVSQSIETIYQRALQKRIEIINEIDDTQKVYVDEKMIDTVLRNLLSNAVKFTRKDGKTIIKSESLDGDKIEVSVEDNGVGISEKNVKRLFKIEEKVSSQGTDGESSTGLGLLLCKEFIERNGGKIWVESEEGKGSKFTFTLQKSIINPA